jgi:hypothetical protein
MITARRAPAARAPGGSPSSKAERFGAVALRRPVPGRRTKLPDCICEWSLQTCISCELSSDTCGAAMPNGP